MKTKIALLTLFTAIVVSGCQVEVPVETPRNEKGMVKVTLLYANGEGTTFDMDYYESKHMPMVAELLGDALKYYKIDKGMAGRSPEEPVPFLAVGYLFFDQLSDYETAFGPVAQQIIGDIPNYTNTQPTLLISEVVE